MPDLYKSLVRPLLFRCDPETVHRIAMRGLQAGARWHWSSRLLEALAGHTGPAPSSLARTVFGRKFAHPLGLAAGFDKDGLAPAAWEALGFSFIEIGTITARPQPGNPRPRLFRLPAQRGLINRLGFNNAGATAVAARLASLRAAGRWPHIPVGINLGKSRVTPMEEAAQDYRFSLEALHPYGDYFVLNVSSPNTPGLRGLQQKPELEALLRSVQESNHALPSPKPILLKIAPDLTEPELEDILEVVHRHELAGIVATNTTLDRSALPPGCGDLTGGLSGEPLRARATAVIGFLAKRTTLPIIGVGGISDGASAREKLDAGATLLQLYTGLVYGGPGLVQEICRGL